MPLCRTWALASAIGPLVGGSLANAGDSSWRWLFCERSGYTCPSQLVLKALRSELANLWSMHIRVYILPGLENATYITKREDIPHGLDASISFAFVLHRC